MKLEGPFLLSYILPQWGTPDFKWWGWSKDLFGFEISIAGFFKEENLASIFWVAYLSRDFLGIPVFQQSEDSW